jgi:hypothetical protein
MKTKFFGLCLMALSLTACDKSVEIKNGELPAELVPYAQELTGTYEGKFNGVPNALTVTLVGNRLSATPAADLIGSTCASSLGDLTRVSYSAKNKETVRLTNASFAFNAGACGAAVEGRELEARGVKSRAGVKLEISLLAGYRQETRIEPGQTVCHTDRNGRTYCHRTPDRIYTEMVPYYYSGNFVKK